MKASNEPIWINWCLYPTRASQCVHRWYIQVFSRLIGVSRLDTSLIDYAKVEYAFQPLQNGFLNPIQPSLLFKWNSNLVVSYSSNTCVVLRYCIRYPCPEYVWQMLPLDVKLPIYMYEVAVIHIVACMQYLLLEVKLPTNGVAVIDLVQQASDISWCI